MAKKATRTRRSMKPKKVHTAASEALSDGRGIIDFFMPAGSPQRTAAGVGAAAVGALVAAAIFGVGPAALAGVAGYLAYRGVQSE